MPLLTAHERPPKFWAIEATLENIPYLENLFRDGEVSVKTGGNQFRMFSVVLAEVKVGDGIKVEVAEGDYFVWEHGMVRESLTCYRKPDFEKKFEVDEVLDTGHG